MDTVDCSDCLDSFVVLVDRMVAVHGRQMNVHQMLDLVGKWANCSMVDWPVAGDLDCQIFDLDRFHRCMHFVDYKSPDCNYCHGYSTAAY